MSRERIEELLALEATAGLGSGERAELERLLADHPELADGGFERAAAAIHLALVGPEEPLDDLQRQRLVNAVRSAIARPRPLPVPRSLPPARRAWGGWLAAAACLLLALVGWWPRLAPAPAPEVAAAPALPEGELTLPWQATEDPAAAGAAGQVVWSGSEQAGYMRIRGLEANDPGLFQYQLWIFDRGRDERYPVDGGVFDMPAGADEAIVPIDAKIEVGEPYLFAVTVEKPGGVVVSDRERIVLLAQV